jgi:hypothetical protein
VIGREKAQTMDAKIVVGQALAKANRNLIDRLEKLI